MFDVICSGTGPSFFSMLGVCRALYDIGVPVQNVACTSGSSIPFALVYGAGIDWFEAYNAMIDLDFRKQLRLRPWRGGIYDTTKIQEWVDNQTGGMKLKDVNLDCFAVNSVDITAKRMHVLTTSTEPEMTLGQAVRMTVGIPGIFAPVNYKGKWFVDGGVYRNVLFNAFPNSPNPKLVFVEEDAAQEEVGEVWEDEVPRPSFITTAMNAISCLMKSRYDIASFDLPRNYHLIKVKVHDTSDLSPSKGIKEELFMEGYRRTLKPIREAFLQEQQNARKQT